MVSRSFPFVTVTLNPAIDRMLVMPDFHAGHVHQVESEQSRPGGKGINAAVALARAGCRVLTTGFLGKENAAIFEKFLVSEGIEEKFLRVEGMTRTVLKIADPVQQQTTDINFPGTPRLLRDLMALQQLLRGIDTECLVLAGSVPPGLPTDVYADFVEEYKERGIRVAVDASGEALKQAILARPHVIKPNLSELENFVRRKLANTADAVCVAEDLVASGIELVIVSMGEKGACFSNRQGSILATPPPLQVRATFGAGDAMLAGALFSWMQGGSLEDTARIATAFALCAIAAAPQPRHVWAEQVSIIPLPSTMQKGVFA